jgi:osmotically-inducible protein OsmY
MHRESTSWTKTHQASPAPHRLLAADSTPDAEAKSLIHEKTRCLSEARSRLMASPYSALHGVACTFHEGVLVLHGRVASFYLKQLAQSSVGHIVGVDEVSNRVEVG